MPNNLATLRSKLNTQLQDSNNAVWTQPEKDDLLEWAVAGLWPRLARELDPTVTTLELETGVYFYMLPPTVMNLYRVDWVDGSLNERGPLVGGSWEIVGDPMMGSGLLHVSPVFAQAGGHLRLYGYGRFNTSTAPLPDDYVPLVLATARAEAYRRLVGDRARFKAWLARQQAQNTSVNELILLVNDADAEITRHRDQFKTWHRPVPGRV